MSLVAVPSATTDWVVETRRGDDGLAGLGSDWDDLAARCAAATPFQSYGWLDSWWRTYGRAGRLRLTLVRHRGLLVAAAPLMLTRRAGIGVLTPIGGPLSDYTDVLVDDAFAGRATPVLVAALLDGHDWQVVDLPETRPGAVAGTGLRAAWRGPRWAAPASLCLELPAVPMADLVAGLPTHSRKTVRRRLNQLGRAGVEVREVPAGDAARGVRDLLRLHALQWTGRGVNPHHLSRQFARHLTTAAGTMIGSGQAALLEYRLDGRLRASSLMLIGPGLVGGYLYGADPGLRDRVDVTTMLLADTLPTAHRRGCSTMSMLRGAEPHKRCWQPHEARNRRVVLARPRSLPGAAYVLAARGIRAASTLARRHAPWLRTLRDHLRHSAGGHGAVSGK